ncbi:MAG TPA: M48 family metallopeptidase [Nitrospirales bacterium]|nr:M48 family metallopeptidase [Nitrospirales bacterium]
MPNPFSVIRFQQVKLFCVLCMLTGMAMGCETVPYTDRSQLVVVPQSQAAEMGEQAFQQILSDPKVQQSQSAEEQEAVNRVADRIIQAAKESKFAEDAKAFQWEVTVIKDDQTKNAFALPGGKIAVYTGIFPVAKNDAGLAAILGHEVVHALARHGSERMSQEVLSQAGLSAAAVGLGASGAGPVVGQATMAALGLGAKVGVLLPYSRTHESEADTIGILLAAKAGYDPQEAVRVWQRMQEGSQGTPSEFLSTHPSHETRITRLKEAMPEALEIYQKVQHAPDTPLPPVGG